VLARSMATVMQHFGRLGLTRLPARIEATE
jgi:hypothetical protein